ncbi:hypothetical protein BDZ88DRAFT_63233 [Geranomyces variabilis]|nr:hypothetical protein BDZ88DRAFT_63233 [Geranomyces variabilis]KAJ3135006.1 hypothetical protein HDU90_004331 [Geranomyces variabilis]
MASPASPMPIANTSRPQHFYLALSESKASRHALRHVLLNLVRSGDSLTCFCVAKDTEDENALLQRLSTLVNAFRETYRLADVHIALDAVVGEPGPMLAVLIQRHNVQQLIIGDMPRQRYVMNGPLSIGTCMSYGTIAGYLAENLPLEVTIVAIRYAEEKPIEEPL